MSPYAHAIVYTFGYCGVFIVGFACGIFHERHRIRLFAHRRRARRL